ncbi:MAG: type I DNA topoisomerase [Bacteroidales bacterium]|nr:type I DNA topoisomerase [Bacteroidales bacterium]
MAENLVIVESPTKANTIGKFLGKEYEVKSSRGHIRDLAEKKLSVDIADGFRPEYEIPEDKKRLVAELKKAADAAKTVWLASDEDREGEAISWHLTEVLGLDKARTRRIVFHEITKNAILEAVEHPRDIDYNLVNAQQARRTLDRLVGFELSPILWRKVQKGLSAGRVQSVTLRLVVDREREIAAFKPEAYYRVDAQLEIGGVKAHGVLDTRFASPEEARRFLEESIGARLSVGAMEKKTVSRAPAPPFTTSTLQQEAAAKLHFSLSTTMRLAQNLYERGLITYMRTDSTNLSSLALGTSKAYIVENFGPEYAHTRQYKTHSRGAQEAHEAIRPTYVQHTTIEGTEQEKRLYNLIWKRTVASQMADASLEERTVNVLSDKRPEQFIVKAQKVLFDGFLKLYRDTPEDGETEIEAAFLPDVAPGTPVQADSLVAEGKFTQPPQRYSDRTLIKKMEELGIGRPSTYAPTVTTLTAGRGYLVKGDKEGTPAQVKVLRLENGVISESTRTEMIGAEKGKLLPQEIGIIVTDYLCANFPDIMDYDFTAKVEKDFDLIAEGDRIWNEVIAQFYEPFHHKVQQAVADRQYSRVERELGTDPADGQKIVARFGQWGPFVQKGEGDSRVCASLGKGQLIENITLEEALKLFRLPRTVGEYEGVPVVAMRGRYGPYIKCGERSVSLPRGKTPESISLEECVKLLSTPTAAGTPEVLREWGELKILAGRYGPYIKYGASNYKLPKDADPASLSEADCLKIIGESTPTARKFRRFSKK